MRPVYEVALVGAKGFLGRAIGSALMDAGCTVANFDLDRPLLNHGRLDTDASGASTVIWAASIINPAIAADHSERIAADLDAFSAALDAMSSDASGARVLLLSSGGTVYGPPSVPPYVESLPLNPVNAYGQSKVAMERALASSDIPGTAIRISNAYGPGQRPAYGQGVVAHWLSALLAREPIRVFGDPTTSRDYVYVGDVARAIVAAHRTGELPPAINIGSGVPTSLARMLEVVLAVSEQPEADVEYVDARAIDVAQTWLSIDLAREVLDWTPSVTLESGVRAAWEALRVED